MEWVSTDSTVEGEPTAYVSCDTCVEKLPTVLESIANITSSC